jgi:hypothetical protein
MTCRERLSGDFLGTTSLGTNVGIAVLNFTALRAPYASKAKVAKHGHSAYFVLSISTAPAGIQQLA